METQSIIRVRYSETDMMGIVHHSRYYPWFEIGRTDFIRQIGMSYSEMEKQGILLPLIETHAKYILPLRYDDELRLITRLSKLGAACCEFSYEIYKGDELCCTGRTLHAITDKDIRPYNLKKFNRPLWDSINGLSGRTTKERI